MSGTNLVYEVWQKLPPKSSADALADLLGNGGAGATERCAIVYCHSQAETEKVADLLTDRGLSAAFYHSQVASRSRFT